MTRSILVNMHKYMPFGGEYFEPIYDYFIQQMEKYKDEFDTLYLLDSNWGIENPPSFAKVLKTDPNDRYFDAYKKVLPFIEEDFVLFLDNDMLIYKPGIIDHAFQQLEDGKADIVSIFDSCGTWQTDKMNEKNKLCPYFFCAPKILLMDYLDIEWGPLMPEYETFGLLTRKLLEDECIFSEMEEDKSEILFDGTKRPDAGKDLGYYHIRAGTTPACLLAWREHRPETYREYLEKQPRSEYLRQACWYQYMGGNPFRIFLDYEPRLTDAAMIDWDNYYHKFLQYHHLDKVE